MGVGSYVDNINEYTVKAEIIGSKYKEDIIVARAYYIRAMSELKKDQLFLAIDTLYLSLEHYRQAEAFSLAFDCLKKINEIMKKMGESIQNTEEINLSPGNYQDKLSKARSLRTKSLFYFKQHKNLVAFVSQRLNFEKDSVNGFKNI